jgi:hypothetical protein
VIEQWVPSGHSVESGAVGAPRLAGTLERLGAPRSICSYRRLRAREGGFILKIQDSSINLASAHQSITSEIEGGRLVAWRDDTAAAPPPPSLMPKDTLQISSAARELLPMPTEINVEVPTDRLDDFEMKLMGLILEALTGMAWDVTSTEELIEAFQSQGSGDPRQSRARQAASVVRDEGPRDSWGVQVDLYRAYRETEKVSFDAEGIVTTEDGREIHIDVELRMAREWAEEHSLSMRLEGRSGPEMVDPLVINFEGTAAELTSDTFTFDLDVDGREDQIAMLAPGSAYLAFDANGDGEINDGSELFGPTSGDGFGELARYDDDGNGWIDEGDDIFRGLRLWSQRPDGTSRLVGLGAAGIGAIYLGHAQTEFQLKDDQNTTLGQVTDTGVFLHEDGRVGTVQELDLVA